MNEPHVMMKPVRRVTIISPNVPPGMFVPVLSQTYRASSPAALQHSVKQLAHSPQRPLLVSRSFSGLLYLEFTVQSKQTWNAKLRNLFSTFLNVNILSKHTRIIDVFLVVLFSETDQSQSADITPVISTSCSGPKGHKVSKI